MVRHRPDGYNFGWPITQALYSFSPPTGCDAAFLTPPLVEIPHGEAGTCSVIAGVVYRGEAIPERRGHYLYSDYCGGWLRSFVFGDGTVTEARDWTEGTGSPGVRSPSASTTVARSTPSPPTRSCESWPSAGPSLRFFMSALVYAFVAAVSYGTSDYFGGVATRRADPIRVVLWSQSVGLALALAVAPLAGGGLRGIDMVWGAAAGLAGATGLSFLYRGLAEGRAAVVAPISGVLAGVLPAVIGMVAGERPSQVTLAGFALAAVAVWLVSGGSARGSGVGLGVAAGLGFGLFFAFLAPIPESAGLWPLVPARIASISVMAALWLRSRPSGAVAGSTAALVVFVGLGDMLANVFILLALQRGPLGEGAVVSSLYPAVTVLWAAVLGREPVRRPQWAGLVLAVVAMGLIAG